MYKVSPETLLRIALEGFDVCHITKDKEKAVEELKLRISRLLEVPINTLFK